ncbi:MAG: hypothetical protein P1V97_30185, partial [Planctomycetota bacterium]|nr:hypothetical protein [Planctomycetota bacterium]
MSRTILFSLIALTMLTAPAFAQDSKGNDESITIRLRALEREVNSLRDELSSRDKKSDERLEDERDLGFQLQLRGEYYRLTHNRRNDAFSPGEDEQFGFGGGIGIRLPLWIEIFDGVDLIGMLDIVYRQNNKSGQAKAPITNATNTSSYANILAGPMLRFSVSETVLPFIFFGGNLQVQTPPTDGITYLDAGFMAGGGVDFKITKKVSIGLDFKFYW